MTVSALDNLAPLATDRVSLETATDAAGIAAVVMAAFGPGRFAKTAERLRERAGIAAGFVDREHGVVVGSVRLWTISIGSTPALFLGPIAVSSDSRRAGRGADLVAACIAHARNSRAAGILLVGDMPYFERFGFAPIAEVDMPGPVDRRRLLWLGFSDIIVAGSVTPVR